MFGGNTCHPDAITKEIRLQPQQPISSMLLLAYYASTAVFMLMDYALDVNIRLTFLDDFPLWRFAYYLLCFGCLALILWRPQWTAYVAAAESLLTLALIILSTAVRVVIVTDDMIEHGRGFVSTRELINFVISATAVYISYVINMRSIQQR